MNDLYRTLSGNNAQQNPMQALQELRNNPALFLSKRGFQVPEGLSNPQQIIQHLIGSNQISPAMLSQAQRMAQGFRK